MTRLPLHAHACCTDADEALRIQVGTCGAASSSALAGIELGRAQESQLDKDVSMEPEPAAVSNEAAK